VESKHEAKVAAEAQLRSQLGLGIVITDSAGGTHVCRIAAVEHAADEIIRVRYQCCGAKDAADLHVAEIDRIHWHTPAEIKGFVAEHIKDAADHCAARLLAVEDGTCGRTRGEAGTAL
jgi:pantoate kinase